MKPLLFLLLGTPILVLFKLILALAGLVMVPVGLLKAEVVEELPEYPSRKVDEPWQYVELRPKWIDDIWGSRKYGAQGNYFWNDRYDTTTFWARFKWLSLRNPVSNIDKKFPVYKIYQEPSEVKVLGNPFVGDKRGVAGWYIQWVPGKFRAEIYYIKAWSKDRCLRFRYGYKGLDSGSAKLSFNFAPYSGFG